MKNRWVILYLTQKLTINLLEKFILVSEIMVWELEVTYYVLLEELDNLLSGDFRKRHYFDPFGEIVGGY